MQHCRFDLMWNETVVNKFQLAPFYSRKLDIGAFPLPHPPELGWIVVDLEVSLLGVNQLALLFFGSRQRELPQLQTIVLIEGTDDFLVLFDVIADFVIQSGKPLSGTKSTTLT